MISLQRVRQCYFFSMYLSISAIFSYGNLIFSRATNNGAKRGKRTSWTSREMSLQPSAKWEHPTIRGATLWTLFQSSCSKWAWLEFKWASWINWASKIVVINLDCCGRVWEWNYSPPLVPNIIWMLQRVTFECSLWQLFRNSKNYFVALDAYGVLEVRVPQKNLFSPFL